MTRSAASAEGGRHADLEALARRGRLLVIESVARAKAGHIGGPLSAMDVLVALYFRVLRIDPARPDWPERDRFILYWLAVVQRQTRRAFHHFVRQTRALAGADIGQVPLAEATKELKVVDPALSAEAEVFFG